MKRRNLIGVCLLALWLCALCVCTASADAPADAARTFVWKNGELTSEDTTAAFWEYPQLTAGQTRRGGTLTLTNQGVGSVTASLTDVQFPYDNDAALRYLNALHLTVRDGDQVLYDGVFARLNDEGLMQPITLKWGETRALSIDLSCDFAYEGITTCGQVLYWDWQMTGSWLGLLQPVLDAWMFWAPALLLIVAAIVWRRVRRTRKQKAAKKPRAAVRTAVKPDPTPELPPDLPPRAPRNPVTIRMDGSAPPVERKPQPTKPEKPVKPTKPAASAKPAAHAASHAASRHAKPAASAETRRRKAAHAAPRHAKKK